MQSQTLVKMKDHVIHTAWTNVKEAFPSIHPFSILSIRRSGRGGDGAYPSCHRAKGGVKEAFTCDNYHLVCIR